MKIAKSLFRTCVASVAACSLVLATPLAGLAATASAAGEGPVYAQADGYEPYSGWQSMPDPTAHSGGGTTASGGYVSWALSSPATLGALQINGLDYTYAAGDVKVVVDTNTTAAASGSTPAYFKNIILDAQELDANGDGQVDEGDTLSFEFLTVSTGGRLLDLNANYDAASGTGGVIVSTSADPADWGDASKVVWTSTPDNTALEGSTVGGNWQRHITFCVPAADLQGRGSTFYLVLESGICAGNSTSQANIVFEFSTEQSSTWSGDVTKAGAVSGQGDTVVTGLVGSAAQGLTCDLTAKGCWLNTVTSGLAPDSAGDVSLTMFASVSGGNWQSESTWNNSTFAVYEQNPVTNTGAAVVADNKSVGGVTLQAQELIWIDGVKVTMSGLERGKTYYLEVPSGFMPGNGYALQRPILYRFAVGTATGAEPVAASTVTKSGVTYKLSAAGKVRVTKVSASKKSVTIPASVRLNGKTCKVMGIAANAFKNAKATTVTVKSPSLTKSSVKNSLKGSKVKTVKVAVSAKSAANKVYVTKYKKLFAKANCGKAVTVK